MEAIDAGAGSPAHGDAAAEVARQRAITLREFPAFTLAVAAGFNFANTGAVAAELSHEYGVSLASVGIFTTALFVAHAAIQLPAGGAIDRFGVGRVASLGAAVIVASNGAAASISDPAVVVAARGAAGVGTGLAFLAGLAFVRSSGASLFAQGLYGGLATAGGGLALAVVPFATASLGWRAPFGLAFAVALVALIVVHRVEFPQASAGASSPTQSGFSAFRLAVDPRLFGVAAMNLISFSLSVVVGHWSVTLLERNGFSKAVAAPIGALVLLLGVVGRPLGGFVLFRWPARVRAAVATSLAAAAAGCVGLAFSESFVLTGASAAVVGVAAGIPFAPAFAGAAQIHADAPGAATGAINMWGGFGVVVGTPLLGLSFSLPGEGRIGFLAVGALALASLTLLPSASELGAPHPVGRSGGSR